MSSEADDIVGLSRFLYKGSEVYIRIFKPQKKWEDSDEFSCRFSILGETISHKGESIGYDSTQSLILTLSKIGSFLDQEDVDQEAIDWPGGRLKFPSFPS